MKSYLKLSLLLVISMAMVSCGSETSENSKEQSAALKKEHQRYDKLLADKINVYEPLPMRAENPENIRNDAKVKLGHMLYYDTRLSKEGNQSCNTCHNLKTYGVDNLPSSPGDLGELGDRNSPTTLNSALHFKQFWDGREPDVEAQAGGPILNPVEMNMPSKVAVEERLRNDDTYKELFTKAFPNDKRPISYINMQKAIGSFERELITPSRFDEYLKGKKDALSLEEKKGLLTFSLVGCTTCHSGALLGGNQFQRFGVHKPYWEATGSEHIDKGVMALTGDELDEYMFKVPSLRNITETGPYFHDGSVEDLKKATKIMAEIQLDYQLNKDELNNLMAFMEALKGEVPAKYQENPLATSE